MAESNPLLLMTCEEAARAIGRPAWTRRLYRWASMPGVLPAGAVVRVGRALFFTPRFFAWAEGALGTNGALASSGGEALERPEI